MNYNPYAPPQAAPPNLAPLPPTGPGQPQPWEIGEVLSAAFEAFKANWVVLVFSHLMVGFIAIVPMMSPAICVLAGAVEMGSGGYWGIYSGSLFVTLLIDAFFYVGLYRISLAAAKGQQAEFGTAFSGGDRFLPMLGAILLLAVVVMVGYAFLIVPGILLSLGLFMALFFVVDQGLGPIDALQASWAATKGHKMHLFLFGLVAMVMFIGGYVACFVGVFVVMPILSVAMAIVYLRITGRAAPAPAYAMQYPVYPPGYPPQGGYGPQGGPPGGGYGGPPGGGGYGGPPQGGGGYGGPPGGGGYGGPQGGGQGGPPPGGGGGYGPPGGGGGYGPPGGYNPGGGGGYGPQGGGGPPPQ